MVWLAMTCLTASPVLAECRVPELLPGAISHLSTPELVDTGHYLRAEKALEAPQTPRDQWLLSKTKAALGKLDEAITLAEAALTAEPNNAAYHVQVAAVSGRLAEKANFLKKLGYVRRAKQELDAAAALDTKNTEAQWGLMMYFFAAPPLVGGDKAKALQIGEQLATEVPDLGRYYQGRLAAELKELDKAEAFYKQSVGENPLLFDTISALERGEQTEPAVDWLKKYLSRPIEGNQPAEALARVHLAGLLAKSGKLSAAIPELQAAIELDSSLDTAKAELKKLTAELKKTELKKNGEPQPK